MNPVLPPPPTALNDALALVRLALNPKEANDYLEQLSTQAALHESARNENQGRTQQLDVLQKNVATKEAALRATEADLAQREAALADNAKTLRQFQQKMNADSQSVDAAKVQLEADRATLEAHRKNADQAIAAGHQALDEREKVVAEKEAAHTARLARFKELA
jgi:hypothetical protein